MFRNERVDFLIKLMEEIHIKYERDIRETENERDAIQDACEHIIPPEPEWEWDRVCIECGYYCEGKITRAEAQKRGLERSKQ